MKFEFSHRAKELILHIDKYGFVTKDTKPFLSSWRFYNYLWILRDFRIIEVDGINDNHQKRWCLTGLGKEVAKHLKAIEELMENES